MWITQVELHQIKSYGKRTTIDLAQGVNAICGKNGAGKSTILEAIGLALFGKSAYKNQEQFIHEKAKKGEITITLFDSRDERLYQVVRPIKGSAPYVYDPETRRELATGVEDVQQWLRDCIRVEPTTDLKALFENAIGVAQGLLTVSFLETEANRRKVFDPLLNVEDYKQAYDKLRAVNTQVKEWQNENTAQQARLEGQLEALPGHQAEVQELTEKIQTTEGQLTEVSLKLKDLAERLAALEKQKAEVDRLTRQVENLAGQVAAGQTQLQAAQAELERAMQAKAAVEQSEADYRTYEEAQKERDELEKKRQSRDKIRQRLIDSERQVSKLEQNADHLQQQLQDVAQAEARLVELKPQVEQQQSLEGELQQAQAAVEALKRAKKGLADEQQRQEKLEQGLAQIRVEVQQRQALAQEIEQLDQQRRRQLEELDRLNLELAALEQQRSALLQALQEARDGANSYKNLQGRLREANEALPRRQERLRQMQAEITGRQGLEAQREALSERRKSRQAELASLEAQLSAQEAEERQVRQTLSEWQTKARMLENHQANLSAVGNRLAKAEAELTKLEAGVTQRQQHLAEIAALEAEGLEAGQQRDTLKDEASRHKAKLAEINEALSALAVEADSPCPVCRKPLSEHDIGSLKGHYQAETEALTVRLAEATTRLQALESALKQTQRQGKKLQTELETLPNQLQLEKQQELVGSYQAEAAVLQAEIAPLAEAPTQVGCLQDEIGRIGAALSQLKETGATLRRADQADEQQQQQLQTQLGQLARPAEVEPLEGELKALQADLERWAAEAEPLAGAPQRLADLQAEDGALAAQRAAHQKRVQALGQEREEIGHQIQQRQSRMNDLATPARIDALQLELETQKGVVTECLAQVAGLITAPETLKAVETALKELGDPRRAYGVAEAEAAKRPTLEAGLTQAQSQLQEAQSLKTGIEGELSPFANLDADLEQANATLSRTRNGHETYLEHRAMAESLPQREARAAEIRQSVAGLEQQNEALAQTLAAAQAAYNPLDHQAREAEHKETHTGRIQLETQLAGYHQSLPQAQAKVEALAAIAADLAEQKREGERLEHLQEVVDFIRRTIRDAGPEITRRLVRAVSLRADQIFADIINDYQQELIWDENYGITLRRDGYERDFQQLSGGEAMAAALAVRLALLQSMSAVDVAFFDEPTANLDPERRANLAEQIARIKGFSQLVVISHDDTFEQDTGHVIHITKDEQGYSQVV